MNLTAYLKRIRGRLRIPENDAMFPADVLAEYLNDALEEIASHRSWSWLKATDSTNTATVAGQASYNLPSDWVKTRSLTIGGTPYGELSDDEADAFETHDVWTGRGYSVGTSTFTIYPTPGSVETMVHKYTRTEATLVNDSDEPYLPDRHAGVAVLKACQFATTGSTDERASVFERLYDKRLPSLYDDLRSSSGPSRIQTRSF